MTVGRQLFTQRMKSRQERWRERERKSGGGRKGGERKMKDVRVIAHRGGKTGERRSDIDDGILRWTEGQKNRQQSQTRKQPCFAQAGH